MSNDSVVPAVCSTACVEAYLKAQQTDKPESLCNTDVTFTQNYYGCLQCVANSGLDPKTLDSKFQTFLSYCAASQSGPGWPVTYWKSWSNLPGSNPFWRFTSDAAIVPTNATQITTTTASIPVQSKTTFPESTGQKPDATALPQESVEPLRSNAWLAGPIVGGIVGLGFLLLIVVLYVSRAKSKKAYLAAELEGQGWVTGDKAQLHSDDIKHYPLHELDATTQQQYEMPTPDPAATEVYDGSLAYEMPADAQVGAQPDEKAKPR
ncbi:hypothetical protein GQ53DRAFT_817909 [Thozetella sp. PMI_491]|nr:hypothetical protein GQ53DRAFT_817909 [Thozetella sp. PMI_491]